MESFHSNKEAVLRDLVDQVQRAVQLLNRDVSAEYFEAVAHAPDLVRRESRIIDFLRTEAYHALRAAKRLALYWKTRREFFGQDRWLLPMTQVSLLPQKERSLLANTCR